PASGDAAQLRRDGERRPAAPAERGALGEIGEVGGVRQRPEPLEVRAPRGPAVDAGEQPLGDHSLSARDDAATIPFTEPPAASIDSTNASRSRCPALSRTSASTREPASATTEPV